jgi:endonuclease I
VKVLSNPDIISTAVQKAAPLYKKQHRCTKSSTAVQKAAPLYKKQHRCTKSSTEITWQQEHGIYQTSNCCYSCWVSAALDLDLLLSGFRP